MACLSTGNARATLCLYIGIVLLDLAINSANSQEYCENEVFNATCAQNEVVLMTMAVYGRMRKTRCVKLDYGHMGCQSDVIELIDARCSGRRQCDIGVPDTDLSQTLPCPDDLKPYLEASFLCIPVHSPKGDVCNKENRSFSGVEGYLSSVVTQETLCGGIHSPWIITVQRGQTISVHLMDFAIAKRKEGFYSYTQCQLYGAIRERTAQGLRNVTICGGTKRQKLVYSSATNQIEIAFKTTQDTSSPSSLPYYVFKYEAIGCPDRRLPPGTHAVRAGDDLKVTCNFTNEVFRLKCVGRLWVGELRNCSKSSIHSKSNQTEELGIPYGLSILIVLAIALVIGIFVLFIGLVFLKKQRGLCFRRRARDVTRHHVDDTYDKQYVRSPWIQAREDGTTIASVTTKPAPWREGTYGHAPSLLSDLPPCTPLMDQHHRPPSYGQALTLGPTRARLACGCHLDGHGSSGDLCDYPSRHDILATTCCPGRGQCASPPTSTANTTGSNTMPAPARNVNLNPDRLVLKPGDRAQYFVVDHNAAVYSVRPENPRAKVETNKPPNAQTDDVKLKLKVTDKPLSTFTGSSPCREESDKGDPCPESRPLITSESPTRRQSPRREPPAPRRHSEVYQPVAKEPNDADSVP